MTIAATAHVVLLALSAVITTALGVYAWRNRAEHGATEFCALVSTFTVYAGTHLVGLLTTDPGWRLFWESVQWTGTAIIPVFWVLFAVGFTGTDDLVDRKTVALLSVVPAVTIVLTWTNQFHGLMWADSTLLTVDGLAIFERQFGPWFWVNAVFIYTAVAGGGVLLLRLVWFSDHLYVDQAALLTVGATVPVLASLVSVLPLSTPTGPQLDLTPYSFVVSGIAFGYALFRRRLFDVVPATRQLGRSAVVQHLEDGAIIVDTDRTVLYLNPAAATLFGCPPDDAVGRRAKSLFGVSELSLTVEDAYTTFERDGRVHQVRTSPINDRHGQTTGYTLIVQDITARKRRERQLADQHARLERLDELNVAIRGVHRAIVAATNRAEIRRAVCSCLVDSGVYQTACAADMVSLHGREEDWTVFGTPPETPKLPADLLDRIQSGSDSGTVTVAGDPQPNPWTVVPLVYGPTVYGILALRREPGQPATTERERDVLVELGELIGHASNAVENRQLLSAESVVELEFQTRGIDGTLPEVAAEVDSTLELHGFVPNAVDGHLAYIYAPSATAGQVVAALSEHLDSHTRAIQDDAEDSLVECTVSNETVLGALADEGAHVRSMTARESRSTVTVEVLSDAPVRTLVEKVQAAFPSTSLSSKRTYERPVGGVETTTLTSGTDLTDRQREVLETAYHSGYFEWPRGSTAEEIAETLGITAPTLHAHLRKVESAVFNDLLSDETLTVSEGSGDDDDATQ